MHRWWNTHYCEKRGFFQPIEPKRGVRTTAHPVNKRSRNEIVAKISVAKIGIFSQACKKFDGKFCEAAPTHKANSPR